MKQLKPLQKTEIPLYRQVYELAREKIADGEWEPGRKLPSDRELSAMLGVNAITLSKALNMLRSEGLLTRCPGHGTYVGEDAAKVVVPRKTVALVFDSATAETFQQVFFLELHRLLESVGLSMLFFSSDNDPVKQLRQLKQIVRDPGLQGCLFWSILTHDQARELLECKPKNFPLVFMDKHYPELTHDYAAFNNFDCGREMGRYFLDREVTRFIWIEDEREHEFSSIADRRNGLKSILPPNSLEEYQFINDRFPKLHFDKAVKSAVIFSSLYFVNNHMEYYLKLEGQTEVSAFASDSDSRLASACCTGFVFSAAELAEKAVEVLQKRLTGSDESAIAGTVNWKILTPEQSAFHTYV